MGGQITPAQGGQYKTAWGGQFSRQIQLITSIDCFIC